MSLRKGEDERETETSTDNPPSPMTSSDELIDVAEITDFQDRQSLSTSAVLSRCKRKILKPHLRLLSVTGFRGFGIDRPHMSGFVSILDRLHLLQVVLFTLLGYFIQYAAVYRRDLGLFAVDDPPSDFFGFVVPGSLHFSAYAYLLYLFRFKETEQLENLMERTFLLSADRTDKPRKAHLVRSLWTFISASVIWVVMLLLLEVACLLKHDNHYRWDITDRKAVFEGLLTLTAIWQDLIQATVITSYCLQVQLLTSSLHFLREKLLQHTIEPLSWIREINECRNFLDYLNDDFSPGVCLFVFLDASWSVSGFVWLVTYKNLEPGTKTTVILTVGLWLVAALSPFVMASRLTSSCDMLRRLGHEVRSRPFVYQDTPGEDLDTILLFTSTLKMKSKLFAFPVSPKYLFAFVTLLAFSVLGVGLTRN